MSAGAKADAGEGKVMGFSPSSTAARFSVVSGAKPDERFRDIEGEDEDCEKFDTTVGEETVMRRGLRVILPARRECFRDCA